MKRLKLYKILYVVSLILLIIFAVVLAIDHRLCYKCDPGYFFILLFERMFQFLLPALISFVAAVILKTKSK